MAMVHCFAATDVGHVRTSNEDCYATSGGVERDRWSGELDPMRGWALVADGMGAHAAGEVASALAAAHLASVLPSVTDFSGLADAVEQTNRLLFETMALRPEFTGMGTTVVGVCYEAERLVAFNVGDSRIYAYENGRLAQLSEDHVVHGHFLTQCLGGYASPTSVEPNIVERELIRPSRAPVQRRSDRCGSGPRDRRLTPVGRSGRDAGARGARLRRP